MGMKVNARQTMQNVGKHAGQYRYVMQTELYNRLSATKVLKEAALRSGIPQGTMNASWSAIGEVIKAWATEGHSVAIPGLGSMRFSVRAKSVEKAEDVSKELITSRRVIFVPSVDIKQELQATAINITCYDKDGKIVKQVTSTDDGNVEDNDGNENQNQNENNGSTGSPQENGGSQSGSTESGGTQNGGSETGGDPSTGSGQDNGGGGGNDPIEEGDI